MVFSVAVATVVAAVIGGLPASSTQYKFLRALGFAQDPRSGHGHTAQLVYSPCRLHEWFKIQIPWRFRIVSIMKLRAHSHKPERSRGTPSPPQQDPALGHRCMSSGAQPPSRSQCWAQESPPQGPCGQRVPPGAGLRNLLQRWERCGDTGGRRKPFPPLLQFRVWPG